MGILLLAALAAVAGCADPPEDVPVPSFPTAKTVAGAPGQPGPPDPGIPDDCERLLPVGDLVALLGLPLDSVAVRTTIGVPEPSVGRVERVACRYTGTHGRVMGDTLLELNSGRYVDDAAAERQWRLNTSVESGTRRDVRLGTAPGVIVERSDEALLSVVHRDVALTLVLPATGPRAPGRSTGDTLTDLALRVLAKAAPEPATGEPIAAG